MNCNGYQDAYRSSTSGRFACRVVRLQKRRCAMKAQGSPSSTSVVERAPDTFRSNGTYDKLPLESIQSMGIDVDQPLTDDTEIQQVSRSQPTIPVEQEDDAPALSGSAKGLILLNIGAALFGSNQVVIKTAEEAASPNVVSAVRFLIAAVCFAPKIVEGLRDPYLRRYALELGAWLFGGYQAQAYGLSLTSAAHGAFTGTFTVLVVPLLVGLQGREIANSTWIGSVVALAGVGLLTTSGADFNPGDAWCILSAILFGVHKWRSEQITSKFDNTLPLVGVQIGVLAALSSMFCVPQLVQWVQEGAPDLVTATMGLPWPQLVFMGLATTSLTLWIEMESLKEVSAPLAALVYTSEPLWGAAFAYMLLGERWGPTGWIGAALIIVACLYSQLEDLKRSKQKAAMSAVSVSAAAKEVSKLN